MERCIYPDCTCEGYKQPTEVKGTLDLLLLRRCCSGCGHMSSEHRALTSADTLVRKEVGASRSRGCVQSIPVMDIPRSPVFRSHDPIYLPWGDFAQDCSVVCACRGFVLSNMVAVQQSLQGVALSRVREELGGTPCSFCHHPLSQHKGGGLVNVSKEHSEITTFGRLKFQSLCQLNNMVTPCSVSLDYKNKRFIFACLCSSNELAILTSNWDSLPKDDSVIADTIGLVAMDTTNDVAVGTPKKTKKRSSNKRSSGVRRRSVRLEARKIAASDVESLEQSSKEPEVPLEGTVRFMSDLKDTPKWNKLEKLPNFLRDPAGVVCCSTDDGVLLAVACQSGGAVGLVPKTGEMVWSTLEQNNYTCASLSETPEGVLISMGTDRGEVIIWLAKIEKMAVSVELVTKLQDTLSQVTVLSWSPNGELLALGSLHGEVLLYSNNKDGVSLSQTLSVCGSGVTSAAWSGDGKVLAVGGNDDGVYVIVAPATPVVRSPVGLPLLNNLFNYFPRLNGPQFQHTLTLKGHQSFVADILFTRSGLLLSLGWDGQLLIWNPSHDTHPHTVDSDPMGGFKIGPSIDTQFLPLSVIALNSGLLVTIRDKKSKLSVIFYSSVT